MRLIRQFPFNNQSSIPQEIIPLSSTSDLNDSGSTYYDMQEGEIDEEGLDKLKEYLDDLDVKKAGPSHLRVGKEKELRHFPKNVQRMIREYESDDESQNEAALDSFGARTLGVKILRMLILSTTLPSSIHLRTSHMSRRYMIINWI